MKANAVIAALIALFLSVDAYAQSQPDVYKRKPRRSPEEWAARRTEKKLKMKDMTRSERKAYKKAHRKRQKARLAAMSPEKRARVIERRRQYRESR